MPTTKSDLIDELSEKLKLPKGKAELVVNCIFDSMISALQRDERIEIRGFGSFEVRNYKAYEGRNPRTGDPVHVKPKKLPFFKVGKELRERVNGAAEDGASQQQQSAVPRDRDAHSAVTAPYATAEASSRDGVRDVPPNREPATAGASSAPPTGGHSSGGFGSGFGSL